MFTKDKYEQFKVYSKILIFVSEIMSCTFQGLQDDHKYSFFYVRTFETFLRTHTKFLRPYFSILFTLMTYRCSFRTYQVRLMNTANRHEIYRRRENSEKCRYKKVVILHIVSKKRYFNHHQSISVSDSLICFHVMMRSDDRF